MKLKTRCLFCGRWFESDFRNPRQYLCFRKRCRKKRKRRAWRRWALRNKPVKNLKLRQWARTYPHLCGYVIYDELGRQGYTGKIRILREYLAAVRPNQKEVYLRIETAPGEQMQVDWANCGSIVVGQATRKLSAFVAVLSYSRLMYLEFTLSQCQEDFIRCHINAFRYFSGICRKILYDNLKLVVLS